MTTDSACSGPIMPGRASTEGVVLVLRGVWGVVGGDGVDGPVGQRGADGLDVLVGAQRRVDLEGRVVARQLGGAEQQVVRGDLGRDADAAGLGPADDVDALPPC